MMAAVRLPILAQQEVRIKITEGMPMIPVALPEFSFTPQSVVDEAIKTEMHNTLWDDLTYSRVFKTVPKDYYAFIPKHDPTKINYKDWASIQANILISGQIELSADQRIIFSINVYDVKGEKFIFGRNFGGKVEFATLIAHRAADAMMTYFGEKPIFTTKIAFVSNRDGNDEIYIMDYDGKRQTRVTYNQDIDILPNWSFDREKILYTSYRKGNADLYMFYLYTGKTEVLATGGANYSADWSREGDRITYTSTRTGDAEIFIKDMNTRKDKQITFTPAIDTSPCWSPNGREIAFVSNRNETAQVYLMDAEGSNIRRITSEGVRHDSPEWSPDGAQIAYTLVFGGTIDIYIFNLKNNTISKLTEKSGRNENPTWCPDSRHLIFSSNRSGAYQLYTVDYDGANLRQLTSTGENKMPAWQK
jgi:TolB protein